MQVWGKCMQVYVSAAGNYITSERHQSFNWPFEPRERLLALARKYGVKTLLCTHVGRPDESRS